MTDQVRGDLEKLLGATVEIEPIPEGHSGFTYFVRAGSARYVLRVPPPGARIAGPADVVRQGRIMTALHDAGLPTPTVTAMSSEPVVDARPSILMEQVAGERIEKVAQSQRPLDIAGSAVEVLRRLQSLPPQQTGIGEEEAVGLPAEMMRWGALMQRAPEELT